MVHTEDEDEIAHDSLGKFAEYKWTL